MMIMDKDIEAAEIITFEEVTVTGQWRSEK